MTQVRNATPTQIALAWQIARASITAPIVSATSPEQLDELVKPTTLRLNPDEMETLTQASNS